MKYSVKEIRAAGLEARWTKTSGGAPIIAARHSEHKCWYVIERGMWKRAQEVGIKEAFDEHTLLGQYFSIAA